MCDLFFFGVTHIYCLDSDLVYVNTQTIHIRVYYMIYEGNLNAIFNIQEINISVWYQKN